MSATTFDHDVDAGALAEFIRTGDVGHLLPLADYATETDRPELASHVRQLLTHTPAAVAAVRFFAKWAGYSYGADGPTAGRIRRAIELVGAEEALGEWLDARADWQPDPDAEPEYGWEPQEGTEPQYAYGCTLLIGFDAGPSLWNIWETDDTDANDRYRRVIEAELMHEFLTSPEWDDLRAAHDIGD